MRVEVRAAAVTDLDALAAMRACLWPEASAEEHRAELVAILAGRLPSTLPLAVLVAETDRRLAGFVEVGLRSHADGCDPARPCGFVEGWYVAPAHRARGVGRLLIGAAEDWARAQGATELASDTWIESAGSQAAHAALGFEVVDRCVNYRKPIARGGAAPAASAFYGRELARVHHERFGGVARAAARELLGRLHREGVSSGTIVDLGAGSGILARAALEAGFQVFGVELSQDMLRIARAEAAAATFVTGSLWRAELPPCVAVAAVGEVFSYAADPAAGAEALEERLAAIHRALAPGGVLLFDVAGPGRSGPARSRRGFWRLGDAHVGLEEQEDAGGERLTRELTLFVPVGGLHRAVEETHVLRLFAPEAVEERLTGAGFSWERLARYDDLELAPGWHAWAAVKQGAVRGG